ncbi:hypothetical protein PAHAL_3G484000 [Panicum hallii]|uniref:Uncharacterized protein n=1 Tax=Panicum hallii TaxID=206008 RepID=A0A2T8KLY6_9POAL|nr:hypothetical protein PAHAL_3G484000 [Panicum hallii]
MADSKSRRARNPAVGLAAAPPLGDNTVPELPSFFSQVSVAASFSTSAAGTGWTEMAGTAATGRRADPTSSSRSAAPLSNHALPVPNRGRSRPGARGDRRHGCLRRSVFLCPASVLLADEDRDKNITKALTS